jgi:ribosome biogenesis GTPase A
LYVDGTTAYNETMNFFDMMFQIANKPSIYVLDTPGVLVPSISDIETGLKLALAGTVSID